MQIDIGTFLLQILALAAWIFLAVGIYTAVEKYIVSKKEG